jgi:acetoin utilization deacetylase AcuC-like enzyme
MDVHHGNGTEEIVRNLRPHTRYLPLPSSYAPIGALAYKPWYSETDPQEVFFASLHLFADDKFYPGTGHDNSNIHENINSDEDENIVNICLTPIGPVGDARGRGKLSLKQKNQFHETASREMRDKVQTALLPRLQAFGADLLLLSAGFDAHMDDLYHWLDDDDFHWLVSETTQANSCL